MSDELIPANASEALVLATAQHQQAQQEDRIGRQLAKLGGDDDGNGLQLATLDSVGGKRKADWARNLPVKRGTRWGLHEDKPFKPLPYVDLPVGLSDAEIDQFLREQRLEDLHVKLVRHQLEDLDPDIRAPSPPPVYGKSGERLNTREVRLRKAMVAEYNRLIRYMIKNIEGYVPPVDWKPQKLQKKIIIPYEKYPSAPFMGVIIGARGVNHKRLQEATGCRIFIRGRDIGDKWQTDEEQSMPQHVHVEADTEEQIEAAEALLKPLLNPESPEFEYARTNGMQQLAKVNGFSLEKKDNRCGVCGAIGHLGFECPETDFQAYKMANVKCTICGDKGHVASDCKQALEKHQQENVDWKMEAEKKQEMDADYYKMMSELGMSTPKPSAPPNGSVRPPPARPLPPRPMPLRPSAADGARAALALASSAVAARIAPGQLPRPARPLLRPLQGLTPVTPRTQGIPPSIPPRPPIVWQRPPGTGAGQTPTTGSKCPPPPAAAAPGISGVDNSTVVPTALVGRLSWTVRQQMGQETCTTINLGSQVSTGGGQHILIGGVPEARERAKLHLKAWLDQNMRSLQAGTPAYPSAPWNTGALSETASSSVQTPPPAPTHQAASQGITPQDGLPPLGFPPGTPSAATQPNAVPTTGFPPGVTPAASLPPPPDMTAEAWDEL